jgi:hypothetical protein
MSAALWIAPGAGAALLISRATVRVVQGGRLASVAIGMLGGFVSGATMHLVAGEGSTLADVASPPAALVGGVVLIAIAARAARLDPRVRA